MSNDNSPRLPALSPRESEVLKLAAEGLVDKEIAARTGVGLATIRTYWERIRSKLGAFNRSHAIALAMPQNKMERLGEELSHLVVRSIHDEAIFVCDRDLKLLTWNKGVELILGYTENEWVGQKADIFFIPEDKKDAPVELKDAAVAGASLNERWHRRKDGERFWGANTVVPLDDHAPGTFVKMVRPKPPPESSK